MRDVEFKVFAGPAADADFNPMFLVVQYETLHDGAEEPVYGLHGSGTWAEELSPQQAEVLERYGGNSDGHAGARVREAVTALVEQRRKAPVVVAGLR